MFGQGGEYVRGYVVIYIVIIVYYITARVRHVTIEF